MTRQGLLLTAVAVVACLTAAPVLGQERPGSFYAGASATAPYQRGERGEISTTYVTAPGGWTVGWAALAGVFVSPWLSAEVELSSTGVMRATERSRYDMTFWEERRDNVLSVNARLHFHPRSRLDIEPVVGFLAVSGEQWTKTEVAHPWAPAYVTPREHVDMTTVAGFSVGLDCRIGGRHLAVVPSFRWQVVFRGDVGVDRYPDSGLPVSTFRPAVGIRYDF